MSISYEKYIPDSKLPEYTIKKVGCKVSWYTFKNEDDAKKASEIAEHNAAIDASHGYDFGFPPDTNIRTAWGLYPVGGNFDDESFIQACNTAPMVQTFTVFKDY